jgi:hypothetical protein
MAVVSTGPWPIIYGRPGGGIIIAVAEAASARMKGLKVCILAESCGVAEVWRVYGTDTQWQSERVSYTND